MGEERPPPTFPDGHSVGVRADYAVCECEHHELGAGFELQLAHDVRAMRVDCANGDEELLADLLIRVVEGQQVQDVPLSVGQWRRLSLASRAARASAGNPAFRPETACSSLSASKSAR
jgi:hypothetical protein